MISLIVRFAIFLGIMVLNGVLLWSLISQRFIPIDIPADKLPAATNLPRSIPAVHDESSVSEVDYSNVLSRPLFFKDRRFPDPVSAAEPMAPLGPPDVASLMPEPALQMPRPDLKVVGIIIADDIRTALVSTDQAPARWYVIGQSIEGYEMTAIGADYIEFKSSGSAATVKLYRSSREQPCVENLCNSAPSGR